jgi:hypothetical protein
MENVRDRVRLAGLRIADPQGSKRNSLVVLSLIVAGMALLIILGRLFVVPSADTNKISTLLILTQNVCDHLIATCIVVSIGSVLLAVLADPEMALEDISAMPAHHIHSSLLEPLSTTANYWFRGRSGRFFRQSVLPALVEAARRNASRRQVFLLLPDPDENAMLDGYARYRNSLHFGKQGEWTKQRVQAEVLATILTVAEKAANNSFFEAEISVAKDFALFRIDMSDTRMVMTREDPTWPAIACTHQSKFYSSFQEEIRQGMALGRPLDLSQFPKNQTVNETNFSDLLERLHFTKIPKDNNFAKQVIEAMQNPQSPYG